MSDLTLDIPANEIRSIVAARPVGHGIVPSTFQEATELANALLRTGCFGDMKSAGQAVAKVVVGAEWGFSAAFSMMNVYIYNGQIGLEYPAMVAVVKRAGYKYKVIEQSAAKCSIQFIDPDGTLPGPPAEFTAQDAQKAGTQNMNKFPQAMLFARAFSMGCRMYCSDAFAGAVYSKDEVQAMEAEVIEDRPVLEPSSQRLAGKIASGSDEAFNPFPDTVEDEPKGEPEYRLGNLILSEDEYRDLSTWLDSTETTLEKAAEFAKANEPQSIEQFYLMMEGQ